MKLKLPTTGDVVFILVVSLLGVILYQVGEQPEIKPAQSAEQDRQALETMAIVLNITQTNWTILIVPRTNQ